MTIAQTNKAESRAHALFDRAKKVTTGGVTAAGRFNPVLGRPYYFESGDGCRLWDIDGNEYIDFSSSNGASMLGFNHPAINDAVRKAIELGTITTQETQYHVQLAERLTQILPGAERVRFSNTGTEATMAAIRIARAHTGREKILKFDGHFHGMHDYVLFNAHTPERMYEHFVPSFPDSAGIPKALNDLVITIPFNDSDALEDAINLYGHELAAVILEPISYNLGTIPSDREWLKLLRRKTEEAGIVLIFDEVLSGFRAALGGSAEYFGVTPDLSTWAKALAAGWPLAAVTGSAEVMSSLNPVGGAVVSGTYTGHLAAVLASLAALDVMSEPDFHGQLNAKADKFYAGIQELFAKHGVPGHIQGIGARFGLYFGIENTVTNYREARKFDAALNNKFLAQTAPNGLHFHDFGTKAAPMHYGITSAHTDEDLAEALTRLDCAFATIAQA
jgi:glutamate-1-semialdehyde 2,1-aminomutase